MGGRGGGERERERERLKMRWGGRERKHNNNSMLCKTHVHREIPGMCQVRRYKICTCMFTW